MAATSLPVQAPEASPRPEPQPAAPGPKGAGSGRWSLWILLILLGLSVGYVALRRSATHSAGSAASALRTARVARGELRRVLRVNGAIAAKEFAAIVAPRLHGRAGGEGQMILIKLAPAGARVKKGDMVAEFDRQWQMQRVDDQKAAVVQAEAAIVKRRAELDVLMEASRHSLRAAKADFDKAKLDLKTTEIRSAIDAEKLKLAVDEAEARYKELQEEIRLTETSQKAEIRALEFSRDRAKIDMQRAQANAERMVMRAPIDGIVVMQMTFRGGQFGQVQEGDQLWPGQGFMQIVNPAVMVLNATVNQAESQEFRLGQTAQIRLDAYPGESWPGRLISLGAMAGGSMFGMRGGSRALYVKQIPMRFSIQASDARIIPDLSGSATVLLKEEKDVLVAPREAVESEGGKFFVRVQGGGGWERRQVQLGLTNDTHAVVQGGVQDGEEVLLAPAAAPERPQVASVP